MNEGQRNFEYLEVCAKLYSSALRGDWKSISSILRLHPDALDAAINNRFETILHVAARANQVELVKLIVREMEREDMHLTLEDRDGNTAFALAVAAGASQIIWILGSKNDPLETTRGRPDLTPLNTACFYGHKELAHRLYNSTITRPERPEHSPQLEHTFFTCIQHGLYELAGQILGDFPQLCVLRHKNGQTPLHILARQPLAFEPKTPSREVLRSLPSFHEMKSLVRKAGKQSAAMHLVKSIWRCMWNEKNDSEIKEFISLPTHVLFDAAEVGNYDFIVALIRTYPDLLWECGRENRTIFHIAVKNRHANIFSLIHKTGTLKNIIFNYEDYHRDNIFHLVARLPTDERLNVVSGAALQMQHELIWFKEIEMMMDPMQREKKNNANVTASAIFSKTHKNLLKEGEAWMKKTAESGTIVAALTATVVFAVAFSVPGGNNSDTGYPIHIKQKSYAAFSISNGISMFSSTTSILMFLSILISRYAEIDFFRSLPKRLFIGLTSLFISIATMTVTFCMAVFIAYRQDSMRIPILIVALQLIPIAMFLYILYPLLVDIYRSTFYSHSLFKRADDIW